MTYEELRSGLRAVAFTTATPFETERNRVDHDHLAENLRTLYEAGARTFIPCGNTGEYYSLSQTERIAVVRSTVEALPADATIVGGAGGSTKDTKELLGAYEEVGVDGAMIMHPGHAYIHEEGLIEYYRQLLTATDLGVVIYKRGPEVSERVITELAAIENFVAVKYAVNDVKAFSRATSTIDGDVLWLTGVAERFAPAYALEGADGFTTGIGNFLPEPVLALNDAIDDRDWKRATRIRDTLRPLEDLREEAGKEPPFTAAKNVPVVKHGLDIQGMHGGPVRPPLVPLSRRDRDRVATLLDAIEGSDLW